MKENWRVGKETRRVVNHFTCLRSASLDTPEVKEPPDLPTEVAGDGGGKDETHSMLE